MSIEAIHVPGEGDFPLIKPLVGYKDDLLGQIKKYPYQENVFLMMKFRSSNRELSDFMIEALAKHGLKGVRADAPKWDITRNVYNPIAVLYCCKFGIALFDEAEESQAFSPNVAYELGMMHYQRKECLILRHKSLPAMPFDIIKDLHQSYEKDLQVRRIIEEWILRLDRGSLQAADSEEPELIEIDPLGSGGHRNAILVESERLLASGLTWRPLSKNARRWKLTWKITVQNRSRGATGFLVRVAFLDKDGFALADQLAIHKAPLEPLAQDDLSDHTSMNIDLASQVVSVSAKVDVWGSR